MSFRGNTNDDNRNEAQSLLSKNIGNESTHARSVELAIRAEAKLFEQMGKRSDNVYKNKCQILVKALKDEREGFELSRKLLCGELAPEKWVLDVVPKKRAELSTKKQDTNKSIVAPAKPPPPAATTTTTTTKKMDIDGDGTDDEKSDEENNEQDKSKVDKSSYYFFKSTPKDEAHRYAPKPLDASVAEHVESQHKPPVDGLSAWNKGGTWEDRNMSQWARKHLKMCLADIELPELPNGRLRILNSWTVTGDASIIYVRGKKKCGYELTCSTRYEGEFEGAKVKGNVKVASFDETEGGCGDLTVKVSADGNTPGDAVARACALKCVSVVKERVKKFHTEFKDA